MYKLNMIWFHVVVIIFIMIIFQFQCWTFCFRHWQEGFSNWSYFYLKNIQWPLRRYICISWIWFDFFLLLLLWLFFGSSVNILFWLRYSAFTFCLKYFSVTSSSRTRAYDFKKAPSKGCVEWFIGLHCLFCSFKCSKINLHPSEFHYVGFCVKSKLCEEPKFSLVYTNMFFWNLYSFLKW